MNLLVKMTLPLLAAAGVALPAQATIILVRSSLIQGENVLFNTGQQSATTVTGFTNQSTRLVDFTSSSTLRASGGQAKITGGLNAATNNPNDTVNFTNATIDLQDGGLFNDAEFSLFGGNATAVNFTAIDDMGEVFTFSNLALTNGQNQFGFQGINGETIRSISFTTVGGTGVQSLLQVRLNPSVSDGGGTPGGVVPEPATWAMLIVGFGLTGVARRRQRSLSVAS